MITDAEALQYARALRDYIDREAEGEPLPDDALSMSADLIEWVEAHV